MRRRWLVICLFVGLLAYTFGVHSGPAVAQQTFLPVAFQPGSKLTLNNDRAAAMNAAQPARHPLGRSAFSTA